MFEYVKKITVLTEGGKDISKTITFIKGWQITINSTLGLWSDLKEENYSFLLTRKINQDCLENFFNKIRQAGGSCVNPTPIQFIRSFKKLFSTIFLQPSTGSNCEEDEDFEYYLNNVKNMGMFLF